jgi:hypothetical protein
MDFVFVYSKPYSPMGIRWVVFVVVFFPPLGREKKDNQKPHKSSPSHIGWKINIKNQKLQQPRVGWKRNIRVQQPNSPIAQ